MRKIVKFPSIFVAKVDHFSSFSQLLKEVAAGEYEIKIINKQIKIQPKNSIAYVNIVKDVKGKNTEFHTDKSKQEKGIRIVFKHIHATTNLNDIKKEIKELGHTVTNIWNIKKQGTKKAIYIFYIELKPKSNNKNIYNICSLLQCRVKFKSPHSKHEIHQCIHCHWYSHKKFLLS
jgi:hypothetical protein